jgi:ABC-type amino acid transport substrate-binding protein
MLFSMPLWRSGACLVGPAGSAPLEEPEAARGRRVAVERGTLRATYAAHRWPDAVLVPVDTPVEAVEAVRDGKVEMAFIGMLSGMEFIRSRQWGNLAFVGEPVTGPPFDAGVHAILPPGRQDLQRWVDSVLLQMMADGTYQRFLHRWVPVEIY